MQSEIALRANLGSKLTTTRSVSEAYEAYTENVFRKMKMTAKDDSVWLNDCQRITQKDFPTIGFTNFLLAASVRWFTDCANQIFPEGRRAGGAEI